MNDRPQNKHLIPFEPGPDKRRDKSGRKPGKAISTILRELMDKNSPKSIMDLKYIKKLSDKKTLTNAEAVALRLMNRALVQGNLFAIKEILDRLEGRSKQPIEHLGQGGGPVTLQVNVTSSKMKDELDKLK